MLSPDFDLYSPPTPAYVVSEDKLRANCAVLQSVREACGAKILLAQKAFSMWSVYPTLALYLDGATSSGLYEARLGYEKFRTPEGQRREIHVFSPLYRASELDELTRYVSHMSFNSAAQFEKFAPAAAAAGVSCGLRLNPEYSTQEKAIYDPCAPDSRLGATAAALNAAWGGRIPAELNGFHLHTLCEQGEEPLEATFAAAEAKFGPYLDMLSQKRGAWLNLGGGHHITKPGYGLAALTAFIRRVKARYGFEIYLEPGEAVALDAGWLVCEVGDLVSNGMDIAVLDASAACHMPDVIEMPYRPPLYGASEPGEAGRPYVYRLTGPTCLAGDVIGDYAFDHPLKTGERLAFGDMAIYSMVKNNTFNGMALPSIWLDRGGTLSETRRFEYRDFEGRLS